MKTDRIFIFIAALAAVLAGMQMSRRGCPACLLLPKAPEAAAAPELNQPTPKP